MRLDAAVLIAFEGTGYTATVRYLASLSVAVDAVRVSRAIDPAELVPGRLLVLALLGDAPEDAMVIGVW